MDRLSEEVLLSVRLGVLFMEQTVKRVDMYTKDGVNYWSKRVGRLLKTFIEIEGNRVGEISH